MSDGMQAVAGNSLRRIIGAITTNRFLALTCGVLVTCIVQSSSITTVMVVGFVNSGVMQLSQAVGVIMGANIGTTITGWILVLNVGKYGLPLLGGSAFVHLFAKQERWRYGAMALMGVGMVFFGLELMKDACSIIKDTPSFEEWFQLFRADSYWGVIKCAAVGCILTTLVQSSSATLGVTISLCYQGIIPYETAAALVLGENVGTTITAFFASLGATTNARRAAYFHVIFNLLGVFWITLVFSWYIQVIQWLVGGNVAEAQVINGETVYPRTTAAIAATHTIFNVANTLLFLPLVSQLVNLLQRIVPAKEFKEKPHLTDLEMRLLETPALAIEQSRKEIEKMGQSCEKMLEWLYQLQQQEDFDRSLADKLVRREQVLDSMQDEITAFVTRILTANAAHVVADEGRRQLRIADEYESISDYITNIYNFERKLRRDQLRFTADQSADFALLNRQLFEYLREINTALVQGNRNVVTQTSAVADRFKKEVKRLRRKHLDDLSNGSIPPQVSVAFFATLNAYSRVRDHSHNIAETVAGE